MNEKTNNLKAQTERLNAFEQWTKKAVWPAYLGCLWAVIYAVFVRFYQAAGGTLGLPGQLEDPKGAYMASYLAGVLIMTCGFILIALVKPWGRVVPTCVPLIGGRQIHRLIILIPTLSCTAYLIAHGISGIITKALLLVDVITIHFTGWISLDVHSLALWDLLFYEPWFVIMGILSGLTASHYALASGISLSAFRRSMVIYLITVFLLSVFCVFYIIVKLT
ncbi:hypothetical protein BABA_12705 [Neobacillus bataviensis LMG 21833]|uniref:DUF3995 domain-containing protein n=1 Tax=Neobacillus bataviensis LMG 21833 TaxID=1117379 RepID=K6E321_9BACI|nr:DUF3995 domain-containing protein [Neobacillus bataviensis]EKN67591.1 hypothetical protein BABA_12705 [Neobacillus bataviensis LMG 21833]